MKRSKVEKEVGPGGMMLRAIEAQAHAHNRYIKKKLDEVKTDLFTYDELLKILDMQVAGESCVAMAKKMERPEVQVRHLINRTAWPGPRQIG